MLSWHKQKDDATGARARDCKTPAGATQREGEDDAKIRKPAAQAVVYLSNFI